RHRDDLDRALRSLVKAANRGGGEDNITVVAFEIADVAVHDGKTAEQALPPELRAKRQVEDEATLDESDAVPVVGTTAHSSDDIHEELAADTTTKRRHLRRRLAAWLVLLVFAAAVAALVVWRLLS